MPAEPEPVRGPGETVTLGQSSLPMPQPQPHEDFTSNYERIPARRPDSEGGRADPPNAGALAGLFQCLVDEWSVVEQSPPEGADEKTTLSTRVFALMKHKGTKRKDRVANRLNPSATGTGDRYDYEQKYPADEQGEGMATNARVWRVYLDEAGQFDMDMVENFRDTVDVILVFAGLFSAIVSTLVSQTWLALQPDYSQIAAALLTELIAVQRSIAAGTPPDEVAPSSLNLDSSTAVNTDRWINGMFFVSLAVSLSTALLAVLVKQWIQAYVSPISGTPQHQGRVRHFRSMGIEQWHVPLIVGLLPTLLHLSLFLFFVGLIALLSTLDSVVASIVTATAILAYTAYVVTNLLPAWYSQCPYKTPLSGYAYFAVRILSPGVSRQYKKVQKHTEPVRLRISTLISVCASASRRCFHMLSHLLEPMLQGKHTHSSHSDHHNHQTPDLKQHDTPPTLQKLESASVFLQGEEIDARMFGWLCETSANPSVRTIVSGAVSDLRFGFPAKALEILRSGVLRHVCSGLKECTVPGLSADQRQLREGMDEKAAVHLQAHLQFSSNGYGYQRRPDGSCQCDWKMTVESQDQLDEALTFVELPVFVQRFKPAVKDLVRMQPPATSKQLWISQLRYALFEERSGGDQTTVDNYPGDAFGRDTQSAFASLWVLNHRDLVRARMWVEIVAPADAFSFLQGILLSAYLCRWVFRYERVQVDDHALFESTMNRGLEDLARAFDDPLQRQVVGQQYRQLRLHYDFRTTLRVLIHLAYGPPSNRIMQTAGPLVYVVDTLFPLRDYLFQFSQSEPEHLPSDRTGIYRLQNDHLCFYEIRNILIPTPASIGQITHPSNDPSAPTPLERIDMVLCICHFLVHLNPQIVLTIVGETHFLGALDSVRQHLLSPPKNSETHRRSAPRLVDDIVSEYLQCMSELPNYAEHVSFVLQHLEFLCMCAILEWPGWVTLSSCLRLLVVQRPMSPMWEEVMSRLAGLPEMAGHGGRVDTFVWKLRRELTEAQHIAVSSPPLGP